jgi:hypothetical protein
MISSHLDALRVLPLLSTWWALAVTILVAVFSFWFWITSWPGRSAKIMPMKASKFSPVLIPNNLDTIVIGSGSGGCACSNMLAQSGQRVLLLEQHEERTGGCTHSFREKGCEWDTGLHYTSLGMSSRTQRPGALLYFMTKGKQKWARLEGTLLCSLMNYVHDSVLLMKCVKLTQSVLLTVVLRPIRSSCLPFR